MPAPTPPSSHPATPDTPDRSEGQDVFNTKAFAWNDWFAPFSDWVDTVVDYINDAITWITGLVTSAQTSETNAAASAASAAAVSNFKGSWSSLTGALNKPATVLHNGAYWALLNNLANVTTSTPSPSNADWAFTSGTRWVTPYTASATLAANSQNTIIATSGAADMSLPTLATNDFIVLHNSPASTQTVRLMNSAYTIRGDAGSISSGTNITMLAGEVIHLKAVSASILEVV